jgi:RimJ/RimL family protein N-acetyltransferase
MKSAVVTIRPWEQGDFARLAAAAPGLSANTLRLRFWTGVPELPASYLRSTAERWPSAWDAVAALDGDALIGWAEYGRYRDAPHTADLGMCVIDAEQGKGIGTALAQAVLVRAREAGLVSIHADIEPFNDIARRAWQRATGSRATTLALAVANPPRPSGRPAPSRGTRTFPSVLIERCQSNSDSWAGSGRRAGSFGGRVRA